MSSSYHCPATGAMTVAPPPPINRCHGCNTTPTHPTCPVANPHHHITCDTPVRKSNLSVRRSQPCRSCHTPPVPTSPSCTCITFVSQQCTVLPSSPIACRNPTPDHAHAWCPEAIHPILPTPRTLTLTLLRTSLYSGRGTRSSGSPIRYGGRTKR